MHPALQVPDLVYLICCQTDNQDAIHLALTCHHLFQLAMPSAWERVKGVPRLFKLLRDSTVSEESDPKEDRTMTKIVSTPELNPDRDFIRYLDLPSATKTRAL